MLNPAKCVWLCFHWKFSPNGNVSISTPPTNTPLIQTTLWDQPPYPIRRLQPNEAHRYLGIYLTTDGNYKQELLTYIKRNQTYVTLLTNCPFPQREVHVIYKQCYLPTVGYPLPATVIPPEKLNKNQRAATTVFLTKMGFPRSFPRAIAYASKDRGGIGLHLCGTDQGLHKVLQLIKHTRTRTSIGQVYNIVTQHYQLMAGLSHLILQDTRPIPWSTALWYDNLCQFLHSIQGQIIIQNPWIPTRR